MRELSLALNGLRELLPENKTVKVESTLICGALNKRIQGETTSDFDASLMSKFSSLVSLDLRNNKIEGFRIGPDDLLFRPILQRYAHQMRNETGGMVPFSINLAGNDLNEIGVAGNSGKISEAVLDLFRQSHGMAKHVYVMMAAWTDADLAKFAQLLPGSKVQRLDFVGIPFSSTGISALAGSLPTSNVTELALASCTLDNAALHSLAPSEDCVRGSSLFLTSVETYPLRDALV